MNTNLIEGADAEVTTTYEHKADDEHLDKKRRIDHDDDNSLRSDASYVIDRIGVNRSDVTYRGHHLSLIHI